MSGSQESILQHLSSKDRVNRLDIPQNMMSAISLVLDLHEPPPRTMTYGPDDLAMLLADLGHHAHGWVNDPTMADHHVSEFSSLLEDLRVHPAALANPHVVLGVLMPIRPTLRVMEGHEGDLIGPHADSQKGIQGPIDADTVLDAQGTLELAIGDLLGHAGRISDALMTLDRAWDFFADLGRIIPVMWPVHGDQAYVRMAQARHLWLAGEANAARQRTLEAEWHLTQAKEDPTVMMDLVEEAMVLLDELKCLMAGTP
jgi:hypothetical protein